MSFNEKMTTIANETRFLVGSTDLMSLDDIAQNLNDANAEVDAQTYLLQQVMDTVNNLPEAGSSGGSGGKKTVTVTVAGPVTIKYINETGDVVIAPSEATIEALSGFIIVEFGSPPYYVCTTTCTGDYKDISDLVGDPGSLDGAATYVYLFLSDGGSLTVVDNSIIWG